MVKQKSCLASAMTVKAAQDWKQPTLSATKKKLSIMKHLIKGLFSQFPWKQRWLVIFSRRWWTYLIPDIIVFVALRIFFRVYFLILKLNLFSPSLFFLFFSPFFFFFVFFFSLFPSFSFSYSPIYKSDFFNISPSYNVTGVTLILAPCKHSSLFLFDN